MELGALLLPLPRPPPPPRPEAMGTMGLGLPGAGRTFPQLLGALLCWKLGVHQT